MLTVAMTWSSSEDIAICYVLLVLWMTSCFHIVLPVEQNQLDNVVFHQIQGEV